MTGLCRRGYDSSNCCSNSTTLPTVVTMRASASRGTWTTAQFPVSTRHLEHGRCDDVTGLSAPARQMTGLRRRGARRGDPYRVASDPVRWQSRQAATRIWEACDFVADKACCSVADAGPSSSASQRGRSIEDAALRVGRRTLHFALLGSALAVTHNLLLQAEPAQASKLPGGAHGERFVE